MNQNIPAEWSKMERILFRFLFSYLTLYFLFISSDLEFSFPWLKYILQPLHYISAAFIHFVNYVFIHKDFNGNITLDDNYWLYVAVSSYLILSILITFIWTILDNRIRYPKLFLYLQTYSRYYLAFVLFGYGFAKLFGIQFTEASPDLLIKPLGDFDTHSLLWSFMGASRSYNFFGGLLETIIGILLLFRKTTIFGALISIAVLINVLMLNIGYDTQVKIYTAHLILIGFVIISADIKRIFNFFFLKKSTELLVVPELISQNRLKWIQYILKFGLITYVMFIIAKDNTEKVKNSMKPDLNIIEGVYDIKEFYINQKDTLPLATDTMRWQKIAITKDNYASIQFMNGSAFYYGLQINSVPQTLELTSWSDSTFNSKLHYTITQPDEYLFEGNYKKDSIRIITKKINMKNYPLLKNNGKIKWLWY